jgi:hypothetical protein
MKHDRHEPTAQPTRHTFRFTEDEMQRALEWWLVAQGHAVPEGKRYVWGLERDYGTEDSAVTLVIDEP